MHPERSALGVRYFAIILRIIIIVIGFKMMSLGNWAPNTPPFCSGVGFIFIGVYFALQAFVGPKAMLCPLTKKCREKMGCKSEK